MVIVVVVVDEGGLQGSDIDVVVVAIPVGVGQRAGGQIAVVVDVEAGSVCGDDPGGAAVCRRRHVTGAGTVADFDGGGEAGFWHEGKAPFEGGVATAGRLI